MTLECNKTYLIRLKFHQSYSKYTKHNQFTKQLNHIGTTEQSLEFILEHKFYLIRSLQDSQDKHSCQAPTE